MKLIEWAQKQPYRVTWRDRGYVLREVNPADAVSAHIPDMPRLVDRAEAWHLEDWLVSSVAAGTIWFVRRPSDD